MIKQKAGGFLLTDLSRRCSTGQELKYPQATATTKGKLEEIQQ